MFTDDQRKIFSKMLDLNYESTKETDLLKKWELVKQLNAQEALLKESMGAANYADFIRRGKQMFAPAN
jgi:hypothetical protein